LAAAMMVSWFAWPSLASACQSFPADIHSDLGLSSTPRCNLCHQTPTGGGPVATPFGHAMVDDGLNGLGCDGASVQTALNRIATASPPVDSDCDGTDDIQQLREGRDPSTGLDFDGTGTPTAGCGEAAALFPAFGCFARVAPTASPSWSAIALAALTATLVARARARARARRAGRPS
jgi:hypothetical protein